LTKAFLIWGIRLINNKFLGLLIKQERKPQDQSGRPPIVSIRQQLIAISAMETPLFGRKQKREKRESEGFTGFAKNNMWSTRLEDFI